MINTLHFVVYGKDAEIDRNFFRDRTWVPPSTEAGPGISCSDSWEKLMKERTHTTTKKHDSGAAEGAWEATEQAPDRWPPSAGVAQSSQRKLTVILEGLRGTLAQHRVTGVASP